MFFRVLDFLGIGVQLSKVCLLQLSPPSFDDLSLLTKSDWLVLILLLGLLKLNLGHEIFIIC